MADKKNIQLDAIRRYNRMVERYSGKAVRPLRFDGYVNLMNRYGTQKDPSEQYKFAKEPEVPDSLLTIQYEGDGLFSKIIDAPAEEAIKHGFTLDGVEDNDLIDFADEALDELDWEETAMTAIKWARLFGGSIAVMLINDGRGLEEPLDWRNIRSIDDIRVYDRSVITPDYSSMYQYDPQDPFRARGSRLGMPETFRITSRYGSFTVHESRCLTFHNGRLPENTSNSIYQIWGMPEYIRIHRALRDAQIAHGSAPKLLERSVQAIYKMKNLAAQLATEQGEDAVLKRLQIIDMARGMMNSMVIDADGEDYDFRTFQFNGVTDVVSASCNLLSAITNIPQIILFGARVGGLSSTDDTSMENWYNYVERIQKRMVKPNLRYLLSVIFQAGVATGEVDEVPTIKVAFNPLWSQSDLEKADLDLKKAQLQQTKAQTAQMYVDMQVIDPTEIRKKLADSEEFDIENMLDEGDEEDLFPEDLDYLSEEDKQKALEYYGPKAGETNAEGQMAEEGQFAAGVNVEAHNTDPGTEGSTSTAAPAATKLPQDMSPEELAKAEDAENKDDADAPGGVGVIVVKDGKILVGIRKEGYNPGLICGPGGHIEDGETPEQAAIREAQEEFGITPKELLPLGNGPKEPDTGITSAVFLCTDYDGEIACADHEMGDPTFLSMAQIAGMKPSLFQPFADSIEMLQSALSGPKEAQQSFDDEKWITINGTHVEVEKESGRITKGPDSLKAIGSKKSENGSETPKQRESAFTPRIKDYAFEYEDEYTDGPIKISELDPSEQYEYWRQLNMEKLRGLFKEERQKEKETGVRRPDFQETVYHEWYGSKTENVTPDTVQEMSLDKAKDVLWDAIPDNVASGWLREANSAYKPRLVDCVIATPESRAAALNVMYENYKFFHGEGKSFEEFLTTPVKMYRGGQGQKHVAEDVFSSYSLDRKIAEKFAGKNGTVYEAEIRPIDTWGSLRDNGEAEIMVPSWIAPNGNRDNADGGPGSGNHGHEGRPGEKGGSLPSGKTFNDRMKEAYNYKANGKDYGEVGSEMRKCLKDLPVGAKFTSNGCEYTKTGDDKYLQHREGFGDSNVNTNNVINSMDPFDSAKCPHFEDPKAADVAEEKVKSGELDPKQTEASVKSTGKQVSMIRDKDGDFWTKREGGGYKNENTGEVVDTVEGTSFEIPEYPSSFKDSEGYTIADQKTMNRVYSGMARNDIAEKGEVTVSFDDVERMVKSVYAYGNGDTCFNILRTQDPERYADMDPGFKKPTEEETKMYRQHADNIEEFIARSQKYQLPVYRGLSFKDIDAEEAKRNRQFLDSLKPGADVSMGHITSWSSNEYTARDYSQRALEIDYFDGTNYAVVFRLNNPKNVVSLSGINPEGECLSPKASKFTVRNVKKSYDEDDDCHYYYVDVEEV